MRKNQLEMISMNTKVKSNMISNLEHYRSVLRELLSKENLEREIRLVWTSGTPEKYENQRVSHEYAKEVRSHLLEAKMQLKGLLNAVSDGPNKYSKVENQEDVTESNFDVPEFETKTETLNYLRELLEEMQDRLEDISQSFDALYNRRVDIHINETISNLSLASAYCAKILQCIHNIEQLDG